MFYGSTPVTGIDFSTIGVGSFIEHAGNILLLHRRPEKPAGGTWGLPAGKPEGRELPHEAMHREIWEETGLLLPVSAQDAIGVAFVELPEWGPFSFHLFRLVLPYPAREIRLSAAEHDAFEWVRPAEALAKPDLFPHTKECVLMAYPEVR